MRGNLRWLFIFEHGKLIFEKDSNGIFECEEDGKIVPYQKDFMISGDDSKKENSSEQEADYRIAAYKRNGDGTIILNSGDTFSTFQSVGLFQRTFLSSGEYSIWSVRRKSDNLEFSVDEETEQGKIKEFDIDSNTVVVYFYNAPTLLSKEVPYFQRLNHLTKKKKDILFTTDDGVGVRYGDCVFGVGWLYYAEQFFVEAEKLTHFLIRSHKTFSTKEKAEEYIFTHKPLLSVYEVRDYILNNFGKWHFDHNPEKLYDLAKQKLNS